MSSDNVTGGDNQQETERKARTLDAAWVVGFVDGEGCFSVSIHRSPYMRKTPGWQLLPVFHVYQHEAHRDVLEALSEFFGCGAIRSKGPRSAVLTFAVSGVRTLSARILPFFSEHRPLVKGEDFRLFADIVCGLERKEHLKPEGFKRLVELAYSMNAAGKQRSRSIESILGGSSETARQAPGHLVRP